MADPPQNNRSIGGCASPKGSGVFDCLLLPLFSLCSRRSVAEQAQAESIDKKPGCADHSEASGDYAPTYFESIDMAGWNDNDEISKRSELIFLDEAVTEEEPEPEPIKLNDLPLLPLLVICGYLRTNGCCKDLNNFRKTCRSFASAVNTFLACRQNLPAIRILKLSFESHKTCPMIRGGFNHQNYFIHPLLHFAGRDGSNLFKISRRSCLKDSDELEKTHDSTFAIRKKTGISSEVINQMQNIQEVLCGPIDKLVLTFWEDDDNDFAIASAILQKIVSWNTLIVRVDTFNGAVSTFILELMSKRASWANGKVVVDAMGFEEETDSDFFLSALDSMTNHVKLRQDDAEELFFGFPTGFWYQWLLQKIREGYSVRFNRSSRPFSDSPESLERLTSADYEIYKIEWCKR